VNRIFGGYPGYVDLDVEKWGINLDNLVSDIQHIKNPLHI
jgi:hypothetical protein